MMNEGKLKQIWQRPLEKAVSQKDVENRFALCFKI